MGNGTPPSATPFSRSPPQRRRLENPGPTVHTGVRDHSVTRSANELFLRKLHTLPPQTPVPYETKAELLSLILPHTPGHTHTSFKAQGA